MMFIAPLAPWGEMWVLALGLYAAGKWASYSAAMAGMPREFPAARRAAFLLMFPGMDAGAFFAGPAATGRWAGGGISGGAQRACGGRRFSGSGGLFRWQPCRALPVGWVGMIGLVKPPAAFWDSAIGAAGVAEGGLSRPPAAVDGSAAVPRRSVGEFWNVRWNTAFRNWCSGFVFGRWCGGWVLLRRCW